MHKHKHSHTNKHTLYGVTRYLGDQQDKVDDDRVGEGVGEGREGVSLLRELFTFQVQYRRRRRRPRWSLKWFVVGEGKKNNIYFGAHHQVLWLEMVGRKVFFSLWSVSDLA